MQITQVDTQLLRLPLTRQIALPGVHNGGAVQYANVFVLVIHLDTDAGHRGVGVAYALEGGGRALKAVAEDDLAPLVVGEDPLDHERILEKVASRLQSIGRRGLVTHAYSAIDLALWDLKGKAAGLPLYKLLGGARESATVFVSDTGWLGMSSEEIIDKSGPYLEQGMVGIKVQVGSTDPETDADRVTRIREALGEDIWFGVDANQRYDYATALSMGRFLEELGVDWFEEPISCEDVEGHARLGERLEIPIAVGPGLTGVDEFVNYVDTEAADVLIPDVTRLGGITPWLRVATLARLRHRSIVPHVLPEIGVHFACGLPNVRFVEYVPWLTPALVESLTIDKGRMLPPKRPGLGIEIEPAAMEKYQVRM